MGKQQQKKTEEKLSNYPKCDGSNEKHRKGTRKQRGKRKLLQMDHKNKTKRQVRKKVTTKTNDKENDDKENDDKRKYNKEK